MPHWSSTMALVLLIGGLVTGCAVQREPMVIVEPEFSYLRHPEPRFDAGLTAMDLAPVELADAPFDQPHLPVELTEPSLLRPARTLAQSETSEAQP